MHTTDPIADYLSRLRNAIRAKHKRVDIPASNLKREITRILLDQKFIASFTEIKDAKQGVIRITLRYADGIPAITGLARLSRPGLRKYAGASEIPRVMNGLGVAIVSTSRGLLPDKQARAERVGGELLCEIW